MLSFSKDRKNWICDKLRCLPSCFFDLDIKKKKAVVQINVFGWCGVASLPVFFFLNWQMKLNEINGK